jgi:hypothetical protein
LQAFPESTIQWESYLVDLLRLVHTTAKEHARYLNLPAGTATRTPQYSLLGTSTELILCQKVFPNWQAALKSFGEAEHRFLQSNPSASSSFGSASPRWASPLWVRVLPVKQGVVLALTLLWSQPAPGLSARPGLIQAFLKEQLTQWEGKVILAGEALG